MQTVSDHSHQVGHFLAIRGAIFLRGILMTLTGLFLCMVTVSQVQVTILPRMNAGWLPLVAIVLLILGVLEGIEAMRLKRNQEFFITLQLAILDSVTAIILMFEMVHDINNLYILAAAYLMYKGFFRTIATLNVHLPSLKLTVVGGILSVILGFMLWQGVPTRELWFLSFCLSLDIATRGYALIRFALWLKSIARTDKNDIRTLL